MSHPLRPVLEPRSVAVVGASSDPSKRGHQVVASLSASGYPGPVYPVNPRGGEILGLPVLRTLDDLPEVPDLAYIARPAPDAPATVEDCGARGIRAAIVPAVGFGESGPEGAEREARLVEAARATGIRIVGPNTSGLLNTTARLHLVGGEPLRPGALAILAQSGNVALDLMTTAASRPIGVSIYVGPGNEADIGFHEYLDFLGAHEPTRAIVLYVEGVRDGRALYETARRVAPEKPIVIHKGGRSTRGRETARSHTGAVAGSHEVFVALARQAGMCVVDRTDELLPVAETLATQPAAMRATDGAALARDGARGIVVLSDGGGHATLAADRLTDAAVPLARLAGTTRDRLRDLLGPAAAVGNPVDVAGATDRAPSLFARALEILVGDPACAGVLLIGLFGGYAIRFAAVLADDELETASALARIAAAAGVPIVVHSLYAARRTAPLDRLLERGVPVYGSLEIAARAIAGLCEGGGTRRGLLDEAAVGVADATRGPVEAPAPAYRWLSETETRALVEAHGVPLVPAMLCRTAEETAAEVAKLDVPCALKAVSPHIPHKTDAGAVALGIEGAEAAAAGFEGILGSLREHLEARGLPDEWEGVLVSPMQPPPVAELLLGACRDPQFGPILTLGLGGIDVELYRDVAILAFPSEPVEIERACRTLRLAPRLLGHRGRAAADLSAVAAAAGALGRALLGAPDLVEIELNPVFAYADRVVAIDASACALDV